MERRLELPENSPALGMRREMPSGGRIIRDNLWEFVPYNDPVSAPKCPATFKVMVHKLIPALLGPKAADRKSSLEALKKLYKREFAAGLQNDLSLNIYTGPVPLQSFIGSPTLTGTSIEVPESSLPILYTGDANYSTKTHWKRLVKYLGSKRISAVSTFQVPHHGSKKNWFKGMAGLISPRFSVFSSDPNGSYHHPDAEVLRDFLPFGAVQVDKHSGLQWTETLQIRGP